MRVSTFLAAMLMIAPCVASQTRTKSHPTMMVHCDVTLPGVERRLRALPNVEVLDLAGPARLECLVYPHDLGMLKRHGFQLTIIHEDLEAFYASRLTQERDVPLGGMGGYLTFPEITNLLDLWRAKYPNLITVRRSIGKSIQSRDQWIVKISKNADQDENEPEIFMHTLLHSREPAGMMSGMHFVEYLLTNYGVDPVVTDLLDNRELWYMPVANPDGYEYNQQTNPNGGGLWRKNRRLVTGSTYGVDLNRNFGYRWGYDNNGSSPTPSSPTYRGTAAFSEPETTNIRNWVNSRKNLGLTTAWDCHCYSALLMFPFGYANVPSPRNAVYNELTAEMVAQNTYKFGPVNSTIYPANGVTVDWYEGDAGLWTWTTEIGHRRGDGFWPPRNRILALAEESLHMFVTGLQYAGPYLITKSITPAEVGNNNGSYDPGERIEVRCVVRNRGVVSATNAKIRLKSGSPFVTIEVPEATLGTVATATDANNNSTAVRALVTPATPPGTDLRLSVEYVFDGHVVSTPIDAICGQGTVLVDDKCEAATWRRGVPTDTATTGRWTWGNPNPTYATTNNKFLVQTGDDHTPGTGQNCYMTGNAATTNGNTDDVDAGKTTLETPALALANAVNPYVAYWRWYMDHGPNPNTDPFVVEVSNDNGVTWVEVDRVTRQDQAWRKTSFRLRDFVKPTATVKLRFVASDAPDDSYCEALIDDLKITDYDDGVRIGTSGSTKIGQTLNIDLTATRSANRTYVTGVAFGDTGFALPSGRKVPLDLDPLFASFWQLPSIFQNFSGALDGAGKGQSKVNIPSLAGLAGARIFAAFLTLDATAPDGVRDVSPSTAFVITP